MSAGLVSVNIPAYNSEKFIERTITSAIKQSYGNIEVVILDDGSSDKTADIVQEMRNNDSRIRYYFQKNKGLAFSRNRLFDLSKGEYIAFLDHDDQWFPDKIESQLALFAANPDTALVYADILCMDVEAAKHSTTYFSYKQPHKGRVFYQLLIKGNFIPLSSVVVKSDILKAYLPFRLNLKIAEEWELFMRIARDHQVDYLNKPLGIYHIHSGRASNDRLLEINERLEIMDYWQKNDKELLGDYRKQFQEARSNLYLQKAYFYKDSRNFKRSLNEIINCIRTYPLKLELYLKLTKYFFLYLCSWIDKLLPVKKSLDKE